MGLSSQLCGNLIMIIKIDDIKVSQRLRELDDTKVYDLMESIQLIGLLQPIVVDSECNLLAGMHRLEAIRTLGHETIECNQINLSELEKDLVEVEENLVRHDLNVIEKSEHIILRESILESLGKRATAKDNQYAHVNSDTSTTGDLADEIGLSKRKYQRIKQVHKIHPEARRLLRDTNIADNLDSLLLIERLEDNNIQVEVSKRIANGSAINTKKLIKLIQSEIKQNQIIEQSNNYRNSNHKKLQLHQGDFRSVASGIQDNSIDMIFTDPPYITDDSLELYEGLSELGNRVLKDGGSCLCYVTQTMLHQVLDVMSNNLDYYWIISIKHGDGGRGRRIGRHGRGVFVEWKPILWFMKGKRQRREFVGDFVFSTQPDKLLHEWEQSEKESDYYISHLTNVGETILDPMMGSGTTGVSALKCNRDFIGIEIAKRTFDIAQARISEIRAMKQL